MEEAAARLRHAGLRVTPGRVAVWCAVDAAPHSDADVVAAMARTAIGSMSTQSVYDALRVLTAAGLMRRLQPGGMAARYETRVGDHHHHAVCRKCGRIEDVDCLAEPSGCLSATMPDARCGDMLIDHAEVTYWGSCAACASHSTGLTDPGEPAPPNSPSCPEPNPKESP